MFHPRIMFNVTEAKGEPRSKASCHALCFQFSIFRECFNESLLTISQQGAVDVQPNLFCRPPEDVVSFSLLIPPSLFFCLPLVPEKSFCLLGFAYDKSLYCIPFYRTRVRSLVMLGTNCLTHSLTDSL